MTYQTRINYGSLLLGVGYILCFLAFWLTYLFDITTFYNQVNTDGAELTKYVSWFLWGFLFFVMGPMLLYGMAKNTVVVTLHEQTIQLKFPLLFKTKYYEWTEIESFSQTRKPVTSWLGRILFWSKAHYYFTFHFYEEEDITFTHSSIKNYKEFTHQLASYPIVDQGWVELNGEKK